MFLRQAKWADHSASDFRRSTLGESGSRENFGQAEKFFQADVGSRGKGGIGDFAQSCIGFAGWVSAAEWKTGGKEANRFGKRAADMPASGRCIGKRVKRYRKQRTGR